jgi:hypothetical protein
MERAQTPSGLIGALFIYLRFISPMGIILSHGIPAMGIFIKQSDVL